MVCFLQMYVAVGFGRDKKNLQGMDVSACYKEGFKREKCPSSKSDLRLTYQWKIGQVKKKWVV